MTLSLWCVRCEEPIYQVCSKCAFDAKEEAALSRVSNAWQKVEEARNELDEAEEALEKLRTL